MMLQKNFVYILNEYDIAVVKDPRYYQEIWIFLLNEHDMLNTLTGFAFSYQSNRFEKFLNSIFLWNSDKMIWYLVCCLCSKKNVIYQEIKVLWQRRDINVIWFRNISSRGFFQMSQEGFKFFFGLGIMLYSLLYIIGNFFRL